MRESEVELALRQRTEAAGGRCIKFVSPGRIGVPDRIVLMPVPPEHRALVAKYFHFVEVKKPKAKPDPHQEREHKRLRDLGFNVDVIDSKE